MFHNDNIWAMAKMLHSMRDTIRFAEDDVGMAIESEGTNLSTSDMNKQKEKFRKELAEKKKSPSQLSSTCYDEGDGSSSSIAGAEEHDNDDENTTKYLTRMIVDFQALSSKKDPSKDDVTNISVSDVQVTDIQSLTELQPLALKKWVCC